jgi:hypothetical protein
MNKTIKIMAVIASLLIVFGIFISVISGGFTSFGVKNGLRKWSAAQGFYGEPQKKTLSATNEVNIINVSAVSAKIKVISSDIKTMKVTYFNSYDEQYTAEIVGNTFNISEKNRWFFFDMRWALWLMGEGRQSDTITIELPKNTKLSHCKLVSVSGSIDAENMSGEKLFTKTISGEIKLDNATFESFIADTVSGDIKVENANFTQVSAETVSGSISFDTTVVNNIKLKTVSGSMNLSKLDGNASDYNINFSGVSGSLYVNGNKSLGNNTGSKSITVNTVSGNLNITTKNS